MQPTSPRALIAKLFVSLALFAVITTAGCSRDAWLVPERNGAAVVALFGPSWSGSTAGFRVESATLDRSVVHVRMQSSRRSARVLLSHRGFGTDFLDGEQVARPDRDLAVAITCGPNCSTADRDALRALATRLVENDRGALFRADRGWIIGRERLVAWWTARALWSAFAVLLAAVAWRLRAGLRARAKEFGIASIGTVVVTLVLGRPTLANWYANFAPAWGPGAASNEMNGVGGLVLENFVRRVVPWNDALLFALNLVLHASTAWFLWLTFLELAIPRRTAALAVVLWALVPFSLRAGWSDAQHVLADCLFAVASAAWSRGVRTNGRIESVFGLVAAALMARVRVDAGVYLAAIALLGLCVRAPRRRRIACLAPMAILAAWSAWEVRTLYVERFRMPPPTLAGARDLIARFEWLRQFGRLPSGMPNWFPVTASVLTVLGLVALARKRWPVALAIVSSFFIAQAALGRLFLAEGLVGARYFLPLVSLIALAMAHGVDALVDPICRATSRFGTSHRVRVPWIVSIVAAALLTVESWPHYRAEYTFGAEYRFLLGALARLPDGARVHYPSVHGVGVRADADCCLDLERSTLTLAFPRLRFTPVAAGPAGFEFREASDTPAYFYRSALCRLGPTRDAEQRNPGLADRVDAACRAVGPSDSRDVVARGTAESVSTWPFFRPGLIRLELQRLGSH